MQSLSSLPYDLIREAEIVREHQKGEVDPIVEARNMISAAILSDVLLALSDCHFYEYLRENEVVQIDRTAKDLNLHKETLFNFFNYLTGWNILEKNGDDFSATEKGKRYFNSYTRGVLNIYSGAYKSVLTKLPEVLSGEIPLDNPELNRSTRHAAAGTAYATCAFIIPKTLDVLKSYNVNCVVDLGCGTGDFLTQLTRLDKSIEGIGVDMSAAALEQAKDTSKKFEVDSRLSFHQCEIGKDPMPLSDSDIDKVDFLTSMYMLHEFGRHGSGAIIEVIKALSKQFKGKKLLIIEVEDLDAFEQPTGDLPHYGRLDYRLIHYLSRQGLPRTQDDWHQIFKDSGCKIVDPGIRAGSSFIYIIEL